MDDDDLREMATHRGMRLVKSRRRKPGGDFGLYGLKDADGRPAFGFDGDTLSATAEEVAEHLRHAARNDWSTSAEGLPKGARREPAAAEPEPKRRRAARKPAPPRLPVRNLLARLPTATRSEVFTPLFERAGIRAERIVSFGQTTPADAPMVQDRDEWVMVLTGAARLRVEGYREIELKAGDHVWIERDRPHWVTWTHPDERTVWLAFHIDGRSEASA